MPAATPPPDGAAADELSPGLAIAEEAYPWGVAPVAPRTILVSGANGFVGRHLLPRLVSRGHRVRGITRGPIEACPRLQMSSGAGPT